MLVQKRNNYVLNHALEFVVLILAGPSTWWFFHPEQCDPLIFPLQSPVNLNSLFSEQLLSHRQGNIYQNELKAKNFGGKPNNVRIVNDGNALVYTPRFDADKVPSLEGGPLIPGG